jgi:hypothetical protein
MKKVDPNLESAIQKGDSMYSNPWNVVKIAPRIIVIVRESFALLKFFLSISWWDHVMVIPDDRRRIVFIKGILMGLKDIIDIGGHVCPNSTVGEILLWKNAQKKEVKNSTSDAMNKIIPVFRPFITRSEWFPWEDDSRWTSRHHRKATSTVIAKDSIMSDLLTLFMIIIPDKTTVNDLLEAKIGQGLTSTRWKGLNFLINI